MFIGGSVWERTSRTNLFRRVRIGSLSLSQLFSRQVVNPFLFLRDVNHPFLRTVCHMRPAIGRYLILLLLLRFFFTFGTPKGYFLEVVLPTKFVRAHFTLEYVSSVTRKRLYHDLSYIVLPVPMYRSMYCAGPGQDVLKRAKRITVPPWVKTLFLFFNSRIRPSGKNLAKKKVYTSHAALTVPNAKNPQR